VYQSASTDLIERWAERGFWARARQAVPPNVWFLGLTSLLTDVSSEMVASVLPVYLVVHLSLSPVAFGALDGLYNGITALTRGLSGFVADRWRRHKEVAAFGYGLSAICRLGLLMSGRAWTALAAVITVDRLGKGIRTVPRDALISLSTRPGQLASAFGVHRALDAAGAVLGPVFAFVLLRLVPGAFDVVFMTSFCVAVLGVGALVLFVDNVSTTRKEEPPRPAPTIASAVRLFGIRDFRLVVISASGLALLTISDAFIYLSLQERVHLTPALFPLLYVGTALSYLLLAIPAGLMADRIGRPRTFLIGHSVLLPVYALLIVPIGGAFSAVLAVTLVGAYYAATDGVVVALASGMLPGTLRGSGLALLTTATSMSRLIASIAFGWIWTVWGQNTATVWFAVALTAGIVAAAPVFGRDRWNVHAG
jgi:MFS family permease